MVSADAGVVPFEPRHAQLLNNGLPAVIDLESDGALVRPSWCSWLTSNHRLGAGCQRWCWCFRSPSKVRPTVIPERSQTSSGELLYAPRTEPPTPYDPRPWCRKARPEPASLIGDMPKHPGGLADGAVSFQNETTPAGLHFDASERISVVARHIGSSRKDPGDQSAVRKSPSRFLWRRRCSPTGARAQAPRAEVVCLQGGRIA